MRARRGTIPERRMGKPLPTVRNRINFEDIRVVLHDSQKFSLSFKSRVGHLFLILIQAFKICFICTLHARLLIAVSLSELVSVLLLYRLCLCKVLLEGCLSKLHLVLSLDVDEAVFQRLGEKIAPDVLGDRVFSFRIEASPFCLEELFEESDILPIEILFFLKQVLTLFESWVIKEYLS